MKTCYRKENFINDERSLCNEKRLVLNIVSAALSLKFIQSHFKRKEDKRHIKSCIELGLRKFSSERNHKKLHKKKLITRDLSLS